jgi:hypothetical protein
MTLYTLGDLVYAGVFLSWNAWILYMAHSSMVGVHVKGFTGEQKDGEVAS